MPMEPYVLLVRLLHLTLPTHTNTSTHRASHLPPILLRVPEQKRKEKKGDSDLLNPQNPTLMDLIRGMVKLG